MKLIRNFFNVIVAVVWGAGASLAWAGADDDAVAKNVEAFRNAQFTSNAATLTALSATDLSYAHSDGRVEDRASFVTNATAGKSVMLSLTYKNPTIRIVDKTAIVRFNWASEQQPAAGGDKTSTNLHVLMVWQKQGDDWKLLARAATRL